MIDPIAPLHEAIKGVAAEDRSGWVPLALSDRLRDVAGESEALQVEVVRTVAEWDRVTAWAEDGALTAAAWLRHHLPLNNGDAAGLVALGQLYRRHHAVRVGLDGGRLSLAAARVLVKAEKGRDEVFAGCVDGLVDLAAELSVREFAQVMGHWIEQVDDKAPFDDSKRGWRSSSGWDGKAHGELSTSADDMAIIQAVIDKLDTPDAPDCPEGPRTRSQRAHDIIIDVFRRVLADEIGDDPDAFGGADVIVDAETASELTGDPDPAPELTPDPDPAPELTGDRDPAPDEPDLTGDPETPAPDEPEPVPDSVDLARKRRCEHASTGERATLAFAAALICTGWVAKIVRDPVTNNILEQGRRRRLFSRAQRRALVFRDRGCVWPTCDRKARWCDVHHLKPWDEGGLTDLLNGVLLCRRHHTMVHNGWRLRRDPLTGVVTATSPDGREFSRQPGERC